MSDPRLEKPARLNKSGPRIFPSKGLGNFPFNSLASREANIPPFFLPSDLLGFWSICRGIFTVDFRGQDFLLSQFRVFPFFYLIEIWRDLLVNREFLLRLSELSSQI